MKCAFIVNGTPNHGKTDMHFLCEKLCDKHAIKRKKKKEAKLNKRHMSYFAVFFARRTVHSNEYAALCMWHDNVQRVVDMHGTIFAYVCEML